MKHILATTGLATLLLSAGPTWAEEQTVTLAVDNLFCATCPFIVKRTLEDVPGVRNVEVSYEEKTAVVIFDDDKTDVAALTLATSDAGFPSRLVN